MWDFFRIPLVSYCVKKVGFPLTKVSLPWVDGRIDIEICSPSLAAVAALRLDHGTPLRLHPLVLQKRILEVTWPLFCTGDRNSALMSLVVSNGGGHGETKWCLVWFRLEQQPLTSTSAAATSVLYELILNVKKSLMSGNNVWCNKNRTKHSSVLLLYYLWFDFYCIRRYLAGAVECLKIWGCTLHVLHILIEGLLKKQALLGAK